MSTEQVLARDLLRGHSVFITGGGSGINLGVARCFAAVGADLGICGRTPEKLERATEELRALGARVVTSVADVRNYDAVVAALEATQEQLSPISCLVCGAAGNFLAPAEELSPGGFKAVMDIDLLGSFHACRAAFEQLRATRGCVVFISAGQAFTPYFGQAHVGAAKAGVDQLMRDLALEWGRYGIRCNSIAPGPIEDTEGMKRLLPEAAREPVRRAIPLGRFGRREEVGWVAVFLASPLASYVTGSLIVVDGGQNLPGSGIFSEHIARALKEGGGRE